MSYLDSDLGYELGYETETTNPSTTQAPTQASSQNSSIVYRMDGGIQAYQTVIDSLHRSRVHSEPSESVTGPSGEPTRPEGYEGLPNPSSDRYFDMEFGLDDLEGAQTPTDATVPTTGEATNPAALGRADSERAMEDIAGDNGLLASMPGWNPGSRSMFREQYSTLSAAELRTVVRAEDGESPEARSSRIQNNMVQDFGEDLATRIERRYEPGTISHETATLMASQAIRQHVSSEDLSDYSGGESRRAIFGEASRIPEHSRTTDQALFQNTVEHERSAFAREAGPAFIAADSTYYNHRTQGADRRATDATLLLHDRGIADDPAAIQRLRTDSTSLTASARDFRQRIGRGPTRDTEPMSQARSDLMRSAHMETVDVSRRTAAQRFEHGEHQYTEDRADARSHSDIESRETIATDDRTSREAVAQAQRDHEVGHSAQEHGYRLEEQSMQSLMSFCTQFGSSMVSNAQQSQGRMVEQMVQSLSQMASPRAPDPWAAFYAARGGSHGQPPAN